MLCAHLVYPLSEQVRWLFSKHICIQLAVCCSVLCGALRYFGSALCCVVLCAVWFSVCSCVCSCFGGCRLENFPLDVGGSSVVVVLYSRSTFVIIILTLIHSCKRNFMKYYHAIFSHNITHKYIYIFQKILQIFTQYYKLSHNITNFHTILQIILLHTQNIYSFIIIFLIHNAHHTTNAHHMHACKL